MVNPAVNTVKLSGGLGISPGSGANMLCIIGTSDGYGTSCSAPGVPVAVSRVQDLAIVMGNAGPLIRAAAYAISNYGQSVLCTYYPATTAGAKLGNDGYAGTGTALTTSTSTCVGVNDNYEYKILVITGGTIGTAGIQIKYSLDNGRSYSPATYSLGTSASYTIPNTGTKNVGNGIVVTFGTGTLVEGDSYTGATIAPKLTSTDLATPLTNLKNTAQSFEIVELATELDNGGLIKGVLDAWVTQCIAIGKPKLWMANTVLPTPTQTDAEYQTTVTAYAAYPSNNSGSLCAGAAQITSTVPNMGFQYIDPIVFAVAPLLASVSEEVSIAELDLGSLPNVTIADNNGNPAARCHNELINPGLDDQSFLTLRSWTSLTGAYVNMPRMFSPSGSDFDNLQKIRIWNLAQAVLFRFFRRRLQKPVLVNRNTGFILESSAKELEKSAEQAMSRTLMSKPKASFVQVSVSRTDNLLTTTTPTITVDARIIPLAYPVFINLNLGFEVTVTANF